MATQILVIFIIIRTNAGRDATGQIRRSRRPR